MTAKGQYFSAFSLPAKRGEILASDGFPLATDRGVSLLYAEPKKFEKETGLIVDKIAPFLIEESEEEIGADKDFLIEEKKKRLAEKLKNSNLVWIPLQQRIEEEEKRAIESLQIAGLGFEDEHIRSYPEGTASAYFLGFVGKDNDGSEKGYFGLEGLYDLDLRGRSGLVRREKDAVGRPILMGFLEREEERDGRSLLTTIDRTVQFIAAQELEKALEKYGAVSGSVVVMEPETGAILGMVSLPTYDPETYFDFEEKIFPNPAVTDFYEPGSTFKVLVMAAALNEGVVDPETKCDQCAGPITIADYSIHTWNDEYYPESTATEILIHSDNVGMVFVGQALGKGKLFEYLERFGFGQLTGVDLQDDTSPALRPREKWGEIDLATASFGQGIAVSPLQMVRAVGAIANNGEMVKPFLAKGVLDQEKLTDIKLENKKRVISPKTASTMTQMMVEAVEQGETKWIKPIGFTIAGKTGTAQIPVAGHYDEEKTIASFVGFAPAKDSRFVMLVTLREPSSSPWGAETAAPLWFNITRRLLIYFGIPPR